MLSATLTADMRHVQLYDSGAERFQEWVLSASVFPAYVRLLYLAANPVLAHPLYDLYEEGDSSDEEGTRGGGGDGQPMSPEAQATAAFAAAQHDAPKAAAARSVNLSHRSAASGRCLVGCC